MRIVVRNSPCHELESLTSRETAALRSWCRNAASNTDMAVALSVIRRAKGMDGWIACDCLAGQSQALLAPIQQQHTFTLRRLASRNPDAGQAERRPNHASTCAFHVEKHGAPTLISPSFCFRPAPSSVSRYIDPLPPVPDRLADLPDRKAACPRERFDGPSRLETILWRLLDDAQLNSISPLQDRPEFSLKKQLSRMRAAAREFRVLPTWTLNALTSTWAADYWDSDSRWQRMLSASRKDWPPTARRTGYMLLYAKSVLANSIMPASSARSIEVMGTVRQLRRGNSAFRAPFLVLLNTDFGDDDAGSARAVHAYAQPIYNPDTLFPVDTGFERRVCHLLFWLQDALFEPLPDLRVRIIKPLFAIATPIGLCRPDFIIEATYKDHPSLRLVVEAMGMETWDYQAAKARMRPRMQRIGPVFPISPRDLEADHAARSARRLMDWVVEQLRHPKAPP